MPQPNFQYGLHAVIHPADQDRFNSCVESLVADTRPGSFLEQLVVDELIRAQWELRRSEFTNSNPNSEPAQIALVTRATRNWQRATRELAALQTARASAETILGDDESVSTPVADLTKVPARKPATREVKNWHFEQIAIRNYLEKAS